jgi:hypothetical protein
MKTAAGREGGVSRKRRSNTLERASHCGAELYGAVRCGFVAEKRGSGGVLWTCSIFPLFGPKRIPGTILSPGRCGNGHELTPDNMAPAERDTAGAAERASLRVPRPGVDGAGRTLARPGAAARWMGEQNFSANLAGISAPAITGVVVDRTGSFSSAFLIAAVVALFGMLAYGVIVRRN